MKNLDEYVKRRSKESDDFKEELEKELENKAKGVMVNIFYLGLSLVNLFLAVLVTQADWNWFVTKTGAPHMGYWTMFGIWLTASLFLFEGDAVMLSNKERESLNHHNIVNNTGYILFMALISYFVHLML